MEGPKTLTGVETNINREKVLVRVCHMTKSFTIGHHCLEVLKGMNLELAGGEMLGVVGASGVGKSTLLHILGTLDRPTSGKVYFGGVDIFQLKDHELAEFRNRNIGFLFQFHHLLGEFTALENVMMPLLIGRVGKEEAARDAKGMLEAVGLGARFSHKPGELSGGEQQRVAIARALVHHPDLVLADEPTGNLDSQTSASIYELLRRLNEERGQTFIIVTHNSHLADQMDRVIRLVDGKVYQEP